MLVRRTITRSLILLALLFGAWSPATVAPTLESNAQPTPPDHGAASLPIDAQAAVSTALGQDDTAYHVVADAGPDAGAYRAANAAQQLSARFDTDAALLEIGGSQWNMHLRAWGRGDVLSVLERADLHTTANRVEYRHAALSEWYINGPYGLQQGFTLQQPPAADSNSEPLALSLDLGTYRAQLDADRKGATLSAADGSSLRYTGLLAFDADGQPLNTWLELDDRAGSVLNIRVADAGAHYPITIDPLIQQAKLIASDAPGDNFGFSVALSSDGSTALIGAYAADVVTKTAQGATYVFVRGAMTWDMQAKLTADLGTADGHANDRFGISVALSNDGNTALVGADQVDVSGHIDQGAAYVFIRSGNTWTPQAMLIAADGAAGDKLGWSVALNGDGNTALISAHAANVNSHTDNGAAYVFTRTGASWSQQAKLAEGNLPDNTYLGYSVALSDDGNTALLGAFGFDQAGKVDQGAAYTYTRTGTSWTSEDGLVDGSGAAGDLFGRSVALSDDGNTALIGASGATVSGRADQGAVYIFTRASHNWTQQSKLTATDGVASDRFGVSVALMGNGYVAYVGAYQADVSGHADQGAVYSFAKSGSTWAQAGKLTASGGYADNQFGVAVAIGGSTVLAGARGVYSDRGAAYFYVPDGGGTREIKVTGSGNAEDRLGISVSLSNSGYTAVVGAYRADVDGREDQGAVYVFHRSGTTWSQWTKLVAPDGAAGDYFGWSVALSGDSYTAIIGAHQADVNGKLDAGAAYIFVRDIFGSVSYQTKLTGGEVADAKLGYSVALSDNGNIALCGSIGHSGDQGIGAIFTRSGTTWTHAQNFTSTDGAAGDIFGRSVALSADGGTALVGASRAHIGANADQGAAYVFIKAGAIWNQQRKLTAAEGGANDLFGTSVALSDDGNTALVGAYLTNVGANADQGAAYIYNRSGTTWTETEQLLAGSAGSQLGVAVALSADGKTALVGAHGANVGGQTDRGAAYVFKQAGAPLYLWVVQPIITAADGAANDLFGFAVAINDEGDTLLVGAYGANVAGNNNQGAAYVFVPPYMVYLPTMQR